MWSWPRDGLGAARHSAAYRDRRACRCRLVRRVVFAVGSRERDRVLRIAGFAALWGAVCAPSARGAWKHISDSKGVRPMADDRASTTLSAAAQRVFDYLSDIDNLPAYFDRMTSATLGDGETVQTTATMPDGTETAGEAWFHVDSAAKALSWDRKDPTTITGISRSPTTATPAPSPSPKMQGGPRPTEFSRASSRR